MKEVYLTIGEWQRLAATTPLERKRALGQLKRWVTYEIIRRRFSLEEGPFSYAAMGGHAGDVKLEANFEFRFPIVWKLYGAVFVDAGNVWNWVSSATLFKQAGIDDYMERLQLKEELCDGILDNPEFFKQIALGTGAGLRLDIDGLVVRLDFGIGIHAPYQTYRYDKEWKTDYSQPITSYYNMPSFLDGFRVNFGIGYPF